MFCPECSAEYREGITVCPACSLPLVSALPLPAGTPDLPLVRVFATGAAALIPVVKSLLDDAGIEYFQKGEAVQDLIGWGRIGAFNLVTGPVEFFVREPDAQAATELLAPLDRPADEVDGEPEGG